MQVFNGLEDKRVRGRGILDMTCEGEIEGPNHCRFRTNGSVGVVLRGVDSVMSGKSVCWSHFGPWCNLPDNVKVL